MDWFRSYHGAPFDKKWIIVARMAGCRPGDVAAVVWAWFDIASQETERGRTHANADERKARIEEIAAGYGYDAEVVERITTSLEERQVIVAGRLAAWDKRQPKREDGSAERAREWRERKRTQPNANEHRGEERRLEEKGKEIGAISRPARGTRFSADTPFHPTWREFCLRERKDLDPDATYAAFCDHYSAVPGQRGVKLDWGAAWRNWVRRERAQPGKKRNATMQAFDDLERKIGNESDRAA